MNVEKDVAVALVDAGYKEEASKVVSDINLLKIKDEKEELNETKETKQEENETTKTDEKVLNKEEIEKKAKESGWNPEGEKSAEEWLRTQPLYEEIKQRGKEIKQLKRTVDNMKSLMEKQSKLAYEKAIKELENKKNAAEEVGDNNAVQYYQKEIEATQEEVVEELPQEAYDFAERNSSWINGKSFEEMEIAEFARKRDLELAKKNLDPTEHILTLEEHLHKKFPEYFGINIKPSSQIVESSNSSGVFANKNKKKYTINDLNSAQKQVIYDFERAGIITKDGSRGTMTREDYIKTLSDAGELK